MSVPAENIDQSLFAVSGLLEARTGSMKFMAGSRIFEQGESGDCAYMIDSGYVEVSSSSGGRKRFLAALGPGEIFGEMALISGQPRSATATALHETTVISISRKQLLDEVNCGSLLRVWFSFPLSTGYARANRRTQLPRLRPSMTSGHMRRPTLPLRPLASLPPIK